MTDSITEVIIPLLPSIEQLITKICTTRNVPPPDIAARRSLSKLTEAKSIEILTKIGNSSNEIREFSRYICFMVNKETATATSPKEDRVLPQKRSPPVSVTDGSPLSNSKSAHFISPNSKQSVQSPGSSSNSRTILDYYSRSPNDAYGSSNSKKITTVPFSGFENATPDISTYHHLAESSNATNRVQKQLIFLPGDLDDTNHSNVSQLLFDSSNTRHQFSVIKEKQILSPCSSLKGTNAMHNGSLIPHQRSLTQCESIGGPTNSLAISQQSCKEKQILSPSSSLKGTNSGHFYDTSSAMHNTSLIPHQHSITQCESIGGPTNSLAISPQSLLLSELEFRKMFLVYSYVGRNKLEDVVSDEDAIEIHRMKTMTMFDFEAKIWAKYGCRFIKQCDRAMHLDWDSGKTHIYHCYVDTDGAQQFKGPYLNTRRTHLQRELGDDNVLIIQFVDDQNTYDMPSNHSSPIAIRQRLSGGISVGLRQYRLFAFKEGDRKKTKDDNTKKPRSSVKCFFIRKESHAPWAEKDDCILLRKTNHEARCLFMHVHMVSSMAKYVSRCALALSNSIKLRVDLASVNVEIIEDIPCRDEYGFIVRDEDGEQLIHTDGTGFISEDLAILCARDFFEADGSKDDGYEFVDLLKREVESLGIKGKESCIREPCRLFKDGYAVKGTLLVNKKLKNRTIQVRPSMIKVEKDPKLSDLTSFSSLEIVSVSRKPRKAALSKNLIALLAVGGVPKSYFLELLEFALQDAQKVSSSMRAAVRVGLNYAQMDDSATSISMIGSGIPLDEPYLQYRLSILANEERKGLRAGRIPVNESYYLIGTADPTGTLNSDEVCVILENGQISGKVLVYRNPGLDFGDIHILNAKYVEKLEEYVGNAKYGIFFSTKGERSVGTEIANGDFDGDTYWVCRNPQLLHYFKPSEPWKRKYSTPSAPRKKPRELSDEERENEILALLFASQKHGKEAGTAADSWQAHIDQYLTLGDNDVNEKRRIKEKLLQLADLYYDALDAPKSGKTVDIPRSLLPNKYPNYLEKYANKSYNSSSILGEIYDRAKNYQPDYAVIREIWKLSCFNVEIPDPVLNLWKMRYESYRQDMSKAMQSGDESIKDSANIVMNKYKKMLYEAENFASSTRKPEDIYNEALAIYHVSYDYAIKCTDLRKCGFAWKVAGEALCSFHESKTPGRSFPFKSTVLSMLI